MKRCFIWVCCQCRGEVLADEIWGIYHGLQLAWDNKGYKDSSIAACLLHQKNLHLYILVMSFDACHAHLHGEWSGIVHITHFVLSLNLGLSILDPAFLAIRGSVWGF